MKFEEIKNIFKPELLRVDDFIRKNLKSNIGLINDIGEYVLLYGGKRVRPLIAILFGKIFGEVSDKTILMSSIIELIHTATLLHDDVVDLSEKRRGKLSVNAMWGNKEAILVGDFLYTRSFQMMVNVNDMDILKLMASTTNIMSEGEVNQLIHQKKFDISETNYFNIIKCKTAQLFAASSLSSAILSKVDIKLCDAAFSYGMHLGMAYQLIDDMLDYHTDDERFGKNVGDDIFGGTFTLPLISVMSNDKSSKLKICDIISNGYNKDDLLSIRDLVLNSGALNYTFDLALNHAKEAKRALSSIVESDYTRMALSLVDFVVNRKY